MFSLLETRPRQIDSNVARPDLQQLESNSILFVVSKTNISGDRLGLAGGGRVSKT